LLTCGGGDGQWRAGDGVAVWATIGDSLSDFLWSSVSGDGSGGSGGGRESSSKRPFGVRHFGVVSYPVFMPKLSTHHMYAPESIVPHIRTKSVHR
jgi:hypothetical protein